MLTGVIPEFVFNHLKAVAGKLNFIDFTIEKHCVRNGFLGSLSRSRYKIIGQRTQNNIIISDTISVICKTLPDNEKRMQMFNNDKAFEREIFFYNKIQPILDRFQRERLNNVDEDGFVAYPKCYVAERIDDQFIIILDDLMTSGFQAWNRQNKLNIETVSLVLKELGKFHAMSFALRDQCPNIMEELTVEMNDILLPMLKGFYGKITKKAFDTATELVDDPSVLSVYYESLETLLLKLGSDPKTLFNFDDLLNQMKKFGRYGVAFIPFLLQITLSKPEDIIDLDKRENEEEMLAPVKLDIKTKQIYKAGLHNSVANAKRFGWV